MELRHLRYFVAVAEELNFRRAAARLHLAPPPLSRAIRELERELGTRLLDRSTRHVALTGDGRVLLGRARAILRRADEMKEAVDDEVPPSALLRVGMVAETNDTARAVLRTLVGEHPELTVERRVLTSKATRAQLMDGTLDVAVGRALSGEGVTSEVIRSERLAVLVRDDDPLAARRELFAADLAGRPLYLPPESEAPAWHRFVVALLRAAGVEPKLVDGQYGRGPTAFADAVERFGYVAVVVASDGTGSPRVVRRALVDEGAMYPWSVIYADRDPLPDPVRWFVEAARRTAF